MKRVLLLFFLLPIWSSCSKSFNEETLVTPVAVFDDFWKSYDMYYANFKVKNINWDESYQIYRPFVSNNISNDSLYHILAAIQLNVLKDGHAYVARNKTEISSFQPIRLGLSDVNSVYALYYESLVHIVSNECEFIQYGAVIQDTSIGYLRVNTFIKDKLDSDIDTFANEVDEAMIYLSKKKSLIIDVRNNPGGFSHWAEYLAGYFHSSSLKYLEERTRFNKNRMDLKEIPESFVVTPSFKLYYQGRVTILINSKTASAAEIFVLSMCDLENVSTMGARTYGIFSPSIYRELLNGWYVRIPSSEVRLVDGTSLEGVGITPDIFTRAIDYVDNLDPTLQKAIDYEIGK
ncbi:S41 family peptidase [Halosquirtibacter laminarini]|uniref:S41 family peptidase n=1 Tax=Halosquirtibacter laminarini TaxID=3374600 RepID=A0AC61NKS8_9BACT|nr:S41 family peptidase [Prolixibacteraceae bacterium]